MISLPRIFKVGEADERESTGRIANKLWKVPVPLTAPGSCAAIQSVTTARYQPEGTNLHLTVVMVKSKATKKFEKNKLSGVLDKRKETRKIKHRHQSIEKKKQIRSRKYEQSEENKKKPSEDAAESGSDDKPREKTFAEMSVDDFFNGGFDMADTAATNGKRKKQKQSDSSVEGTTRETVEGSPPAASKPRLKRKRHVEVEEDIAESSDGAAGNDESSEDEINGEDDETAISEMKALAEKDPGFYKFLKENDRELLDFDAGEGNLQLSSSDEEADQEPPAKKSKKSKKAPANGDEDTASEADQPLDNPDADATVVDVSQVEKWKKALTVQHSLRTLRQVVLAFRSAVHVNEEEEKAFRYRIADSDVYNKLLNLVLSSTGAVLQHHLPVQINASSGRARVDTASKKFRGLVPLLRTYTNSLLHLLSNLSDDATQKLVLSALTSVLPYILSFKTLLRSLLKAVIELWSSSAASGAISITCFLLLRDLLQIGDPSVREALLKSVYRGLLSASRITTTHTLPMINLIKNSAVELWGLEPTLGYTTGFTSIRHLGLHLRTAILKPSKETQKTVYNWQFVHALDFWSRVLSTHCDASLPALQSGSKSSGSQQQQQLQQLIYPLVQITLGTLQLNGTSATHFPLHLHLLRALLRLCRITRTFIPLAPPLLAMLNSNELRKPPKPSTAKPLDFAVAIRAPASYLRTRTYSAGLGDEVLELLAESFGVWSKSIAFPELALPVLINLKRWLKTVSGSGGGAGKNAAAGGNKLGKTNAQIHILVQKLEMQSRWITERRDKVDFAPTDRERVERFLEEVEWEDTPFGSWLVVLRKVREEKNKMGQQEGAWEDSDRRQKRETNGEIY